MAEQGHLNERGKPFAAKSVAVGERSSELDGADSAAEVAPFRMYSHLIYGLDKQR